MKKYYIYWFFILFSFVACHPTKELTKNSLEPDARDEALFIEGVKQRILGNYDESIKYFNSYLLKFPNSSAANYNLGINYFKKAGYANAHHYSKLASQESPSNISYLNLLIDCAIQTNKMEEAFATYEKLLKLSPDDRDTWNVYLDLLYRFKYYSKANKFIHQYENQYGVTEKSLRYKYRNFVKLNQPDSVESSLQALHNLFPLSVDYAGILAEYYISKNQFDKAQSIYKEMLTLNVPRGNIYLSMANFERIKGTRKAEMSYILKAFSDSTLKIEKKIKFFKLLREQKEFPDSVLYGKILNSIFLVNPNRSDLLLIQANHLYNNERFAEVIPILQKINTLSSGNYRTWSMLLDAEFRTNEYEKMYDDSNKALELFPTQAGFYLYSGIAALRSDREKESLSILKTGMDYLIDNKNLEFQFYSYLGEASNSLKKYDLSDNYFEKALNIDSTNTVVRNNYAYYLSLRNDKIDTAIRLIRFCLENEPTNYIFLDTYAWILFQKGNINAASEIIDKAMINGGKADDDVVKHYKEIKNKLSKISE